MLKIFTNEYNRMIVLEFVKINLGRSQTEKEEADQSFRRVMSSGGTPIVTAMAYCHYVLTDEWREDFRFFKTVVEKSHDLDERENK